MRRRAFLAAATAAAVAGTMPARAQSLRPRTDIAPLLAELTAGMTEDRGGLDVLLPAIAENGHSVPIAIHVASPMTTADHVVAIHVYAERNPRPLVAVFRLGPRSGRAAIDTRMRLAVSQPVTVLATLSGRRYRKAQVDVHVAAAACIDESFAPT